MKILIVDDHAIVREGVKQILAGMPALSSEEAGSGQEALEKVWKNKYDLVLLDISLPGRNGLEILKEIKKERPEIPVLVFSVYPEEQYAVRALKDGASGYLTKSSLPEELVVCIKKILKGHKCVSTSLAEGLACYVEGRQDKLPHEHLSDREFEVMRLIASGKTVKEIAGQLSLSVKTISTYRTRILEKTKMKNNSQLTHYVIKNNLAE